MTPPVNNMVFINYTQTRLVLPKIRRWSGWSRRCCVSNPGIQSYNSANMYVKWSSWVSEREHSRSLPMAGVEHNDIIELCGIDPIVSWNVNVHTEPWLEAKLLQWLLQNHVLPAIHLTLNYQLSDAPPRCSRVWLYLCFLVQSQHLLSEKDIPLYIANLIYSSGSHSTNISTTLTS